MLASYFSVRIVGGIHGSNLISTRGTLVSWNTVTQSELAELKGYYF